MQRHNSDVDNPFRLANQISALEKVVASGKREIAELKQQVEQRDQRIVRLEERVERKDKRISEVLEEKFDLFDQLERLRSGRGHGDAAQTVEGTPAATVPKADSTIDPETEPKTESAPEPAARIPGRAFRLNPKVKIRQPDEGADGSASADKATDSELREWVVGRRPSKIMPEILSVAPWEVTKLLKSDLEGWDEEYKREGSGEEKVERVEAVEEDEQRPNKRRRVHAESTSPTHLSTAAHQEQAHRNIGTGGRRALYDSSRRPHRHGPERYPGRKPVCTSCWSYGRTCDFAPSCRSCLRRGDRCVWKSCEGGEECSVKRCPCLHPGEWDERDDIVVEEGRMPAKR